MMMIMVILFSGRALCSQMAFFSIVHLLFVFIRFMLLVAL